MANIFVNATTARSNSRNNSIIHSEVRSIESAILANVDSGVLYANVTSNTTMTGNVSYYNVWNGVTEDPTKLDQMNYVKDYFVNLGYAVNVGVNATSNNTITWNVSW